jgi:flagellar L-ring protein precursor FlgH
MNIHACTQALIGVALILILTSCAGTMDRLNKIGQEPEMAHVTNPTYRENYRPVSMPMPVARTTAREVNSLWTDGRKGFFKDQRASQIGDILTVMVDIKDTATLQNSSDKKRTANENMDMPGMLGLETQLTKVLPTGTLPANLVTTSSQTNTKGEGTIEREESIKLKIATVITQILPNGNMVISGTQQVRVNTERRDLSVTGVIRPEDIDATNSITYEKIAEARITYGGEGMLTDVTKPRYGNEVMDILLPF